MKRIFVSAGLVALVASGVSALAATYSGLDSSKPWAVSLSLRGYYDDNINTTSSGKKGSFGFEVSPQVDLHLVGDQTDFAARYVYTAHYFDNPPSGTSDNFDHTHEFALSLLHIFSDRYSLSIGDSFVIGQEPDFLRADNVLGAFKRYSGDNIRNYGTINFSAQVTRLFGVEVGYANSFFDYANEGAVVTPGFYFNPITLAYDIPGIVGVTPSLSGINDRMEHSVHFDTHWQLLPQTVLVVGYQFSETDYTGDEPIQATGLGPAYGVYMSDVRNNRSHYGYVGLNHTFTPALSGSVRVGGTYNESYNDPSHATTLSPYVQLNLTYNYAPGSAFQMGFTHDRSSSDSVSSTGTSFVHGAETSVVYASLHHRFTHKLAVSAMGTFQNSTIYAPGTPQNGMSERYFESNLDVEYRFTEHFSMHTGYNYDVLDSDLVGSNYDRNRFYFGATIGY